MEGLHQDEKDVRKQYFSPKERQCSMSQEAEEAIAKHPVTRTHGCEEAKLTAVRSNQKKNFLLLFLIPIFLGEEEDMSMRASRVWNFGNVWEGCESTSISHFC